MRKLRIPLIAVALAIALLVPAIARAASTVDITITATPTYICISISNNPNTWAIGTVVEDTVYWWTADANAPSPEPFEASDMKETLTNCGSVSEDFDIHTHNATGGVGWTISTDDTPGENEFSLRAGITGTTNAAAMVQVISTDTELVDSLAASGTKAMCLRLKTGTFTDGVAKSTTTTITASVAN